LWFQCVENNVGHWTKTNKYTSLYDTECGLMCLSCDRVPDASYCDQVVECGEHQVHVFELPQ